MLELHEDGGAGKTTVRHRAAKHTPDEQPRGLGNGPDHVVLLVGVSQLQRFADGRACVRATNGK